MVPKNDDSVFATNAAIDDIEKIRRQVRAIRDEMAPGTNIHETLDIVVGELSIALEDLR